MEAARTVLRSQSPLPPHSSLLLCFSSSAASRSGSMQQSLKRTPQGVGVGSPGSDEQSPAPVVPDDDAWPRPGFGYTTTFPLGWASPTPRSLASGVVAATRDCSAT